MGIFGLLLKVFLGTNRKSPALKKHAAVALKTNDSLDKVVRLAEEIACATNESLRIANQSTELNIRKSELNKARDGLSKLKKLASDNHYLKLERLQAVEDTIKAIDAETRALKFAPLTPTGGDNSTLENRGAERRLSESDEQIALICIQSCFRVVNESIEIARKSKNLETKLSRLGVARDNLKEAQKQAAQFGLDVAGFAAAETEINRINEAIKSDTTTEVVGMPHLEINDPFASPARNLLKEATVLKKDKKYIEACDKLRKAYLADGSENLMIEERLRLPMYLQLAGKDDDGWDELNRLLAKYTDQFSQPTIANQMRVFLQKGGKARKAVLYGIWTLCKVIEANNMNLDSCYRSADSKETSVFDLDLVVGQTPSGNPIHDRSVLIRLSPKRTRCSMLSTCA